MRHSSALLIGILGAATISAAGAASAEIRPRVIYGDDDRHDLYQVRDARTLRLARSTVALFKEDRVTIDESGRAALTTRNFGEVHKLCPEEPFREQGAGAFCSGSLIGPDLVMTAGHCVKAAEDCKKVKFVFGFGIVKEGAGTPTSVPASEVYGCAALVGREQAGPDWALVRLDRRVANHPPLRVRHGGTPPKGTRLFVIGHPAGLPTKVAGGASVRDPGSRGYFTANLDTYAGNSGSAVFNAVTGEIEGILVRGDTDYVYDEARKCHRSNRVSDDGGRGEDVTDVAIPAAQVPRRPVWSAPDGGQGGAYSSLLGAARGSPAR